MKAHIAGMLCLFGCVLGLAACGSSSSGSDSKTLTIGTVCTCSGSNSADFLGANGTMQAWAKWVNSHGGIQGHSVKVIAENDAGSPSTGLNEVKTLINQDHVVAIVGQESATEPTWAPYTQAEKVPVVGGDSIDPDYSSRSNFFPAATTSNRSVAALIDYAKVHLHQAVGGFLYCVENPACAQLVPTYRAAYAKAGGRLAYSASVSVTQPSYTAQCLAAKHAGVQSLEIAGPAPEVVKIAQDCAAQDYHPTLLLNAVTLTPDIAKQLASTPAVFNADDVPFFDSSVPASRQFHAALKKYAPHVLNPSSFTELDAESWVSGQMFAAAVRASGAGSSISSADIEKGLYTLKGQTFGKLAPPVTFTKGKPKSVACIDVVRTSYGKTTEPQGLKPYCPAAS